MNNRDLLKNINKSLLSIDAKLNNIEFLFSRLNISDEDLEKIIYKKYKSQ